MKADEISDGARELSNNYQRAWRRKNPHKLRQYHIAYWQRLYERQQPEPRIKTADQFLALLPVPWSTLFHKVTPTGGNLLELMMPR